METLIHVGLSNALAATVLAVLAAGVAHFCRRPALVHSLWLLVVLRLLIPPLFSVPIPGPSPAADRIAEPDVTEATEPLARFPQDHFAPDLPILPADHRSLEEPEPALAASGPVVSTVAPLPSWKQALLALWPIGSVVWLVLACRRCYRFGKLLRYARPATAGEQEQVRGLAARIGLRGCPSVWFVPAAVSPMLCALVGAPRLIVPAALWDALSLEQRDALLVHELAHLRRRDHWVRRLEFVAAVVYWWHPVLWWARREIEEAEEQCCDAWVISLCPAAVPAYAEALVATITFLSRARAALPLGASGMGHAHCLRRRLIMIMRGTTPKGLSAAGLAALVVLGAAVLPLFPTWGQTTASHIEPEKSDESPNAGNAQYHEQAVGAQLPGITGAPATTSVLSGQTQARRATGEELEAAEDQVDLLRAQLQAKQAEMMEGKARYQQAQRELEGKHRLVAGNLVSKEELDQARLETEARGATLQGKEAQVKEAEVRLRQAQRLLVRLRASQEPPSGLLKHQCKYIKAGDAERTLKDLLGVEPPNPATAATGKPSTHISSDEATNTVFVDGPPDKVELAGRALAKIDIVQVEPPVRKGARILQTYKAPGGNAPDIAKALKELYQGRNATISPVGKDAIIVLALPDDQEAIEKYVQGAKDKAYFEAIPLFNLEAKKVFDNLKSLFDVDTGTAPHLDIDVPRNLILVKGTKEQVNAIREALKKLGADVSQPIGAKSAEIEKALKENRAIRQKTAEIAQLEDYLYNAETIFSDKNHPNLQAARQRLKKANEELRQVREKLIPEIRQQLAEYHEIVGEDVSAAKDQQLKQLEEKLDKLLSEVEALRRQSRTQQQREHPPR